MIDFGRGLCSDLTFSSTQEWLVTNGIGGYALGTISGVLTRRYHGLLVAALKPPLGRTLLATKFDETAIYAGASFPLGTNRWTSGVVDSVGCVHLERFHLDGTTPVWTYALADALLEKKIWMQPRANTTYTQYRLHRASAPLTLSVKTLVNYRDFHSLTHAGNWQMQIATANHGLRVTAYDGAMPFYLLSDRADATPKHDWYRDFFLSVEEFRGQESREDHLYAEAFIALLKPGESVTFVVSTEVSPNLDGDAAYAERQKYEQKLIKQSELKDAPNWIEHLVLAADQFVVKRPVPDDSEGRTIIAGYHWFNDWGRDTMISLPGLTLTTGRPEVAASILRTFAHFVDKGMIPNRFPDVGEEPEYNTVDATLWYIEALRAYYQTTGDNELLKELFPVLQEVVNWHQRGTRYQIHVDPNDGLLYAGEPGVQLTWMDAKVGDWVVTPRIGKPVEINALWFNALHTMADFARRLKKPADEYEKLADTTEKGFARFWYEAGGYCYDVIDGPEGNDTSLRPNQLFAVSLLHSPLTLKQQKAVVDVCARYLITSKGLRSLAADDSRYIGHYGGDQRQRDEAYHQGTVWSWLIGAFISAHLKVYRNPELACSYLEPFAHHLEEHGLGSVSEIFDGDPPFTPRGCIAQAWGVAELLRAWKEIERFTTEKS
ncbi:amylo-alpha-1,6-glucosidase [Candidatus Acetothermia bacterium]|nr:amylo-alpha-1,6-glucosidase [Candidatus Acetothermia bacterium]